MQDVAGVRVLGQQVCDGAGVFDRGREADAFEIGAQRLQAAEREKHLVAAFRLCQCVDFIHDHPFEACKHARGVLVRCEQCEAFRCCQQNMRRVGALAFLLGLGGVAGAVFDADIQPHLFDRCAQVAFDVSRQRLQR